MRSAPTLSEARLWSALSGSQLGAAFRRQVVIGDFIVDFLAPGPRLVVEVDGAYHERRARADARRDRVLEHAGYRVLRVTVERVVHDLPSVLALTRAALQYPQLTVEGPPRLRARRLSSAATARCGPRPASQVQRIFEEVRKLPRRQQQKVVEVVSPIVNEFKRKAS